MSYYSKVLQPGEQVKCVGRLHWIIYKNAIVLAVLTLICIPMKSVWPNLDAGFVSVLAVILAAVSVVSFVRSWFVKATTEIVVTDKRIIHKTGWIGRRTEEMNITKVETVDVNQGIAGRVLGFGAVLIKGIGGSWEPLRFVAVPLQLRNAIMVG